VIIAIEYMNVTAIGNADLMSRDLVNADTKVDIDVAVSCPRN
jgi:hypothetical protein